MTVEIVGLGVDICEIARMERALARHATLDREVVVAHGRTLRDRIAMGLRLDPEEEFNGADLTIHKIGATAERETAW